MQAVELWNAVKSHLATCLKWKQNKPQPLTFSYTYNAVKKWCYRLEMPLSPQFPGLSSVLWHRFCILLCLLLGTGFFLFCVSLTSQFSCPVLHLSSLFLLQVPYGPALANECKSQGPVGKRGGIATHTFSGGVCLKTSQAWLLSPWEMGQTNDCEAKKASDFLDRTFYV